MKVNHYIITALTLLLTLPAFSQLSIGISGGYAFNHYEYDPQYMEGLHYKGNPGFAIDLPVNYKFNEWLSLSSGLSFQKKGYQMTGEYTNADSVLIQFYNDVCRDDYYLALPILTKYSFSLAQTNIKVFFDAGGYVAYWIRSNYSEINTISVTGYYCQANNFPKDFMEDVDNRFELGIIGGFGVEYLVHPRCTIFFAARCYYALTPQQKDYQLKHFPSRNLTVTGQLGIMYNFKQKQQ